MPSFYSPHLTAVSTVLQIEDSEYHHIIKVFRHKIGDVISLISGTGYTALAVIETVSKSSLTVAIQSVSSHPQSSRPYAVGFSLLRNKNDETIIEKLTELGVNDLFPLETERSVRQGSKNTLERFVKTAHAAIKQCDNPWLPIVHPVHSLQLAIQNIISAHYTPFVCSEKRPDVWMSNIDFGDMKPCFLIGPEGGWSDKEFLLFEQMNIAHFSLCDLILRAETSAIAVGAQWVSLAHQEHS